MKKIIQNKYLLSSFIILLILLISGVSYSWYLYNLDTTNVTFEVDGIYVNYNGGSDISNYNLIPTATKEEGMVKDITVSVDKEKVPVPTFNLYLKVNTLENGLKDDSFKWELYKNGSYLNQGSFKDVNIGDTLSITSNQTISTEEDNYTIYIWIDGNMENPDTMYNQAFDFDLSARGEHAVEPPTPSAVEIISNLYTNASKTTVVNNGRNYEYAESVSMMKDIGGNIRYYGADPDNYIYFNCSDYNNQNDTTCEKWRIIGVFDGKVKIMRNESIGEYSWDTSSWDNSGYGINQWGRTGYADNNYIILVEVKLVIMEQRRQPQHVTLVIRV